MNTISFSLPEIIFSNNSSKEIIKKIGNKKCIVFTSKYWIKSSLLRNLKKKIKFIEIIQDIEPNPEIKKVLETCIDIENTDIIMCIGGYVEVFEAFCFFVRVWLTCNVLI